MSISATELLNMVDGIPTIAAGADGTNVVHVRITCGDTVTGIRFVEWLRDKICADINAARATGLIAFHTSVAADPHDRLIHKVINEGDAAPRADVVNISPRGAP